MDELGKLLEEILNRDLQQIVLSNTRDAAQGTKVKVRPVLLAGELYFQETLQKGTQVFHENLKKDEMQERIAGYLDRLFKQGSFTGADAGGRQMEATVLVSKKGKKTVKVRRQQEAFPQRDQRDLAHNRSKQYILMDGTPVDFLVGLGVQTPDGKVTKTKALQG